GAASAAAAAGVRSDAAPPVPLPARPPPRTGRRPSTPAGGVKCAYKPQTRRNAARAIGDREGNHDTKSGGALGVRGGGHRGGEVVRAAAPDPRRRLVGLGADQRRHPHGRNGATKLKAASGRIIELAPALWRALAA